MLLVALQLHAMLLVAL